MAVVQKTNTSFSNPDGSKSSVVVTFAAILNDAIVVNVGVRSGFATVSTVTDDLGNTYTKKASVVASDEQDFSQGRFLKAALIQNHVDGEVWTAKSTGTVTKITVTLTSPSVFAGNIQSYTGMSAFGLGVGSAILKSSAPSISFTTTANASVVCAGFSSAFALNQVAGTGTLEGAVTVANPSRAVEVAVADATKALTGAQVVSLAPTNLVGLSSSPTGILPATYAVCAVELKA